MPWLRLSRAVAPLLSAALLAAPASAEDSPALGAAFDALQQRRTADAVRMFKPLAAEENRRALYGLGRAYLEQGGCDYTISFDCRGQAAPLIMRAAELGDPDAAALIGLWFQHGSMSMPQDLSEAVRWYEAAGRAGDQSALNQIGFICGRSDSEACDARQAIAAYEEGTRLGNPYAPFALAELHRLGQVVPKDLAKAAHFYAVAAERGGGAAQWRLGDAYLNGDGVPEEHGLARHWYEKAFAQRKPGGALGLAYIHYHGLGVPQDRKRALKYVAETITLDRSTDRLGDDYREPVAKAYLLSSAMYEAGDVLPKNPTKARRMVYAAATYGDPKALALTHKDAEGGDAHAQFALGETYFSGFETPRDPVAAVRWWRKSAGQGHPEAMVRLSQAHDAGLTVEPEPRTAYFWLAVAERLASSEQRRAIASKRREAGRRLSREERAAVELQARGWRALAEH